MNIYFYVIAGLFTFVFLLDTLADFLNLGRLLPDLPKEFQSLYNPEEYAKSIQYQKEGVYFEFIRRTFFWIVGLWFFMSGGFQWVDQIARSISWSSSIWTGLVFVGILSFLRGLLNLPFSLYDTFVIEQKYGFNKTTLKTFVVDLIKGTILGGILGGLVFSGIVYFFEKVGPQGWLYSWISVTLFQILLLFLAPAVIMPLFNKFSPLPESPLKEEIEKFAKKRNFQLSGIYTMDSSKRTTKASAFFTGFGKLRRLVLFDTLVEKQTIPELVAVLAHEIGHFEKKHILKSMGLSILSSGLVFYTFSLFLNNPELFAAFKMEAVSVYATLVFVGFLYSPVLRVLSIGTHLLSRKFEFEADEFAVQTYGKPEELISALKKLSMDNLSHLTPHPIKVLLDYSHPPILERIKALRKAG